MDLFSPLKLGTLNMRNRVVTAPMTRSRAGAGLIVSEAIAPCADGLG